MIETKYFYDLEKATAIYSNQSVQIGLHRALEIKVKPDLLKALAENI